MMAESSQTSRVLTRWARPTRSSPFRGRGRVRGFTLIEAISTIVVLGAMGSIASHIMVAASDGYLNATTSAHLQMDGSIALDRIVRELRNIQLDSDAGGIAPDIESVTASSIEWRDSNDDEYSIALSGANLMLAIDGGAAQVLAADVASFAVQTYDESNAALGTALSGAACDAIRRISVTITLSRAGVTETLRTRIFLRSTMAGAAG